jgi:Ferritin-like
VSIAADSDTIVERSATAPPPHYLNLIAHGRPDDLTWSGYLVQLLHLAASIEHALMVEYLFAAYSLDPTKVTDVDEPQMIANWQSLILSIAKEEMGHLLTVQNVLCLLGAPLNFQPHDFRLERLTDDSLRRYVITERPQDQPEALHFIQYCLGQPRSASQANSKGGEMEPVAQLYHYIIELLRDPVRIPDSAFSDDSYRFQASWDDWGRGHADKGPVTSNDARGRIDLIPQTVKDSVLGFAKTPGDISFANFLLAEWARLKSQPARADVIVKPVATRQQAIQALSLIVEQGEKAKLDSGSHFARFTLIERELFDANRRHASGQHWEPTYPVADDPHINLTGATKRASKTEITSSYSKQWANLFNLRYRMLLTYLSHSFQLARDGNDAALRGAVIHKAFGEMYNLKAIATVLVRLPLKGPSDPRRAGPPFQLPFALGLPLDAVDRWRLHHDLIQAALKLNTALQTTASASRSAAQMSYLGALRRLDETSAEWTGQVITGLSHNRIISS